MKQLCQLGFKCPFYAYGYDMDFCTFPHVWRGDICIDLKEDYEGFEVKYVHPDDMNMTGDYTYSSVECSDCPLIEPGSKADPIMWED